MIKPDAATIEKLAQEYNTIPVCKEIYSDITTPINLLRRIAQKSKRYFLLESVEGGERWSRYSFLGFDPVMRVTCKNGVVTVEGDETREVVTKKPLEVVRSILARYKAPRIEGLPPFTGGFIGYFGYAMMGYAEATLHLSTGELPDCDLLLFDKVIAYDHLRQKLCIVVNMQTKNVMEGYAKAVSDIEGIIRTILNNAPLPPTRADMNAVFSCNVTRMEFCDMVNKAKDYIRDGDIFQAVLSRRFTSTYRESLLAAYRVLRTTNPSPYMVYLCIDDLEVMCSSPETLIRLQNGRLTTFPVAGSRPRGATVEEDLQFERDLLVDEKELAEHNMLVDLARNDLGKISTFSSVSVVEYQKIHRYSKIMHITSCVEGDIRPDCDACDAIEAILPAGTLSGAPKIRACEIIEELERDARGIYGGALGYLDFTGNMDTCIAIRMAVRKGDTVTVQAGAGIVADSIPDLEYEESGNKARAVINAILSAAEVEDGF